MIDDEVEPEHLQLAGRHHRVGWWALAAFAAAGLVLESLQGFRSPWYVDADVDTRRTMFRLAHAHGALLGLVNVAFALALRSGLLARLEAARRTSALLVAGSLAIPLGFVLGGIWFVEADPGYGILLVPVGALALLASLLSIARAA
ncbi:MAG: hypothetical protein IAG13_35360 [Deltaproteobacteria bacterium]|nr:hypothetical protein [Nannocystaceae bacterium]